MATHVIGSPTVSVVMPAYNAERFIEEAVRSVQEQSFTDLEFIIIDDGSTDGTQDLVQRIADKRVRYIRHEENRGLVAVLNEGLELAQGRYIARMDADDVMRDDRLAKQFTYLEAHPGIAVVTSFVDFINTDGEVTGVWDTDREAVTEEEIRAMMPRTNCIAHPSAMMRTDVVRSLRYAGKHEDWDLWLRMLSRGHRIAKIPEPLLKYRVHTTSFMGALKKSIPQETRLLRSRAFYLGREWGRLRFNGFNVQVAWAQLRTMARHLKLNAFIPATRDLYRILTYSPYKLVQESKALRNALNEWKGDRLFLFPYLNAGGAEQVHVDVINTVTDHSPLVIVCGFSTDYAFKLRFSAHASVVELPRLLNHPWTRASAHGKISARLNALRTASLFSSNTTTFFALLPLLKKEVRTTYLLHAFLYQLEGNVQHRGWLGHFDRIDAYVFVSQHAKAQFEKFLFANNIPRSRFGRSHFIPNALHAFGEVKDHTRTGILFVGRDSPEKRLDLFLQLARELEIVHPGRFRFAVVGADTRSGHSLVAFKGMVRDAGELAAIYADHDLLALTSTREGFPMVIMEAMAHGLVVLATPVGDVPNRLDPSFAFITTAVEASVVLKEMSTEITALDADRDRMHRMKAAAIAHAKAEFDPELFRERYRALLIGKAST